MATSTHADRSCTCADEVVDSSLLPLEHVPSLPTAKVQHSGSIRQVGANQNALHPVVEVTHVEYGTLNKREGIHTCTCKNHNIMADREKQNY